MAEAVATLAAASVRLTEASAKRAEAEAELAAAELAAAPEPEPFDPHDVGEAYPPEMADAVLAMRAALQAFPGLRGQAVRSMGGTLLPAGAAPAPKKRAPPGRFRQQEEPPAARSRLAGRAGTRRGLDWPTGHSDAEGLGPQDAEMLPSDGEDEEEDCEDGEVAATAGLGEEEEEDLH